MNKNKPCPIFYICEILDLEVIMNEQLKKEGIPFGTLWALLLYVVYFYIFILIGIYLIWKSGYPQSSSEWLIIFGSSLGFIIIGILGFIPVFFIGLYFIFKDRDFFQTFKLFWPAIIALIYTALPINFPGPIDEIFIDGLAAILEFNILRKNYFGKKREDTILKKNELDPPRIKDIN